MRFFFFFFNDTATTEIYTLSLHDALPIYDVVREHGRRHLDIERRRLADRGDLEDAAQAWRLLGAKVGGGDQDDEGRSQDERSLPSSSSAYGPRFSRQQRLTSASACSSQDPMSISWYIAAAVVRWSRASSGLPSRP